MTFKEALVGIGYGELARQVSAEKIIALFAEELHLFKEAREICSDSLVEFYEAIIRTIEESLAEGG